MEAGESKREEEDLLHDLEEAVNRRNYLLAEELARRLNRPESEIRDLQEKAICQYVLEFRNPEGAVALADEFNFSQEDLRRLFTAVLEEVKEKADKEKSVVTARFDVKAMGYLSLEQWLKRYFKV
ncbi:MAG: hypothetical protein JRJ26_06290 [Deltaproteobacteria bacterium]|nr:hypothetical protein [Deltaproteobacteria bacterium]